MVLQEDQDRVKHLLSEALPMLCKSGLSYSSEFCIEALIGITLDKNDVFLVSIKETIKSDVDIIGNDRTLNEKSVEINVTRMNGNEKLPNRFRRRKRQSCTSRRGLDSGSEQEQDEVEVKRERIASTEPTDEEIADTSFNDGSEAGPIIVKQEPFITESRSYVPSFHSALYPGEGTKLSHHSALSLLQEVDKSLNTPSGAFNTSMNDSLLAEYNEAVNNSALDVTGAIPGLPDLMSRTIPDVTLATPIVANTSEIPINLYDNNLISAAIFNTIHANQAERITDSSNLAFGTNEVNIPPEHWIGKDTKTVVISESTSESSQETLDVGQDSLLMSDSGHNASMIQLENGRWLCCLCQQQFTRSSTLRMHISVVHLKQRRYQCSNCPAKFGKKFNMVIHERNCLNKTKKQGYETWLDRKKE